MQNTRLWTKDFIALVMTNGLLFASFHFLLPTLPIYADHLGATGTEIGLIGGIFGFSAIFIRLFTDMGVRVIGKKNSLYAGLVLSILATMSYFIFDSIDAIILARVLHGFGFGLSTTFAAALAADVIPAARRGEGVGYLGLGSTAAMALAPALGLSMLSDLGAGVLFTFSAAMSLLAVGTARICSEAEPAPALPVPAAQSSVHNRFFEAGTGVPAVLTVLFGAAYGSVNTFIAMLANEVGIDHAGVFFVVGTLFIFISRPFGGRLFDRKGPFLVILPGSVSFIVALVLIFMADSLPFLLLASVFYGLGGGLLLPALMTWMLNLVRADRRSAAGAAFYNMLDIGTSSGLILLGSLAGNIGYAAMYRYVAVIMAAFVLFFVLQDHFHRQNQVQESEEL